MSYTPRLKKEYNERIINNLKETFSYKSVMQVPKLEKIVLSRGVGAAVADKKLIDHAVDELTMITGQKAISTLSKKDVATFAKKHNLPIKDIIFTNGKDKVHTLLRIGSVLHYDDDPHELSLIKSKKIKTIHIKHPLDK